MADQKVTELTEDTDPGNDSLLYSVDDPSGTPLDRSAQLKRLNRGMILIEEKEASDQASLTFSSSLMTEDFEEWVLILQNIIPASDAQNLNMRVSTDGGSSYDSGANYADPGFQVRAGLDGNYGANSGANEISICPSASNVTAEGGVCGQILLFNLNSSAYYKFTRALTQAYHSGGNIFFHTVGGVYLSTTSVNGIQLYFDSGNIASGKAKLYGIRMSHA